MRQRPVVTALSRAFAEWPTLALLVFCYALWAVGTTRLAQVWLPLGMVATLLAMVLHASLQHEAIHTHPLPDRRLNAALVFPALGLLIPYLRFRDTHLAHHHDANLTDPYDDPESNYLDPAVWQRLPRAFRGLLALNNTLAGRLVLGPLIGQVAFMARDARAIRKGDRAVLAGWLWHVPAVALVLLWLAQAGAMPVWAYALSAYGAMSVLKIRTFLEHQAHERPRGRTVIIEDRGPLSLLFLNNNLHMVHHMHSAVPWFRLPALYFGNSQRYLTRNEGYRYPSYADVFRRHLLRAKDPVPHPLWPRGPR